MVLVQLSAPKPRSLESRQEAKEFGETGEQMAARYLEEQGCVILERHYRKDHKEVDIIALDHGELADVFLQRFDVAAESLGSIGCDAAGGAGHLAFEAFSPR